MRDAFGRALLDVATTYEDLLVLDADNATSTRTEWLGRARPAQFLNVGIAEQNMVGMAAGLALAGYRPLVCGFAAMVLNRGYDQVMQSIAYQGLPVTIAGHYAGLSAAREGAVHHAIADLALMRAVPGMHIVVPGCDADVPESLDLALRANVPGYLRLSRDPVADLPPPDHGSLAAGLRAWGGPAPTLIVTAGSCTALALAAAQRLQACGPAVAVVSLSRLKPLPASRLAPWTAAAGRVVTVEDHSVIGGVGSAVAEFLAERPGPPLVRHGITDRFTETGSADELARRYGFTAEALCRLVAEPPGGPGP
jgi:transketolase